MRSPMWHGSPLPNLNCLTGKAELDLHPMQLLKLCIALHVVQVSGSGVTFRLTC